ncbi:MAG: TetR/AcrR family transcriptional regulator [Clostridia bacterium]|nr:TetR/AcrR family transcriptional regulator [Clostridia bacterium]
MPPRPRITRDLILDAAWAIARESGAEQLSARALAQRLGCSTQPILYHFDHVEDIRREIYARADAWHTSRLMQIPSTADPMLSIGLNYVRFAAEERQLFRLLFQSDSFAGQSLTQLIDAPELQPIVEVLCREAELQPDQAKIVFRSLMLLVHGCASMLANNAMTFDEAEITRILEHAFTGLVHTIRTEENHP